jgi:hypothetical protein
LFAPNFGKEKWERRGRMVRKESAKWMTSAKAMAWLFGLSGDCMSKANRQ